MLKTIILNVFASASSFKLKIFSGNGLLIFKQNVLSRNTKLCFQTCCNNLIVVAEHLNMRKTYYISLFEAKCQKQNISFDFRSNNQTIMQFFLQDKNYNLPVDSAVLRFFN